MSDQHVQFLQFGSGLGALVWARSGVTKQMTISDSRRLVPCMAFLLNMGWCLRQGVRNMTCGSGSSVRQKGS
jgi:hypothetical protein